MVPHFSPPRGDLSLTEASPMYLAPFFSHPNDDKDSGFFPRNPSSSSVNSVLGNHHPTPSHGPDGAVPTMADDLGEPAPLWPHDPDAKEVSVPCLTWAWELRRCPV